MSFLQCTILDGSGETLILHIVLHCGSIKRILSKRPVEIGSKATHFLDQLHEVLDSRIPDLPVFL
jgi:hypothetical protein